MSNRNYIIALSLFLVFSLICSKYNGIRYLPETITGKTTTATTTTKKVTTSTTSVPDISTFDEENYFLTQITVGTPPQTQMVSLDTGSDISWVPSVKCSQCKDGDTKFDSSKSKSFTSTHNIKEIRDSGKVASGTTATDNVNLQSYKTKGFEFLVVDDIETGYSDYKNGILSFSYKNPSGKTFLDALKDNKQIGKKLLCLQYKDNSGTFFVGEYPPEFERIVARETELKTKLNGCKVTNKAEELGADFENKWVCDLKSGIVGSNKDNTFKINGFAFFDSGSTVITAPEKWIDMFKAEYVSKCDEHTTSNGERYFDCETSVIDLAAVKPLNLVLGGWAYEVPAKSLYKLSYNGKKYEFTVRFTKNVDIWGLGKNFMSQFTTVFNQEDGTVSFAGGKTFKVEDSDNDNDKDDDNMGKDSEKKPVNDKAAQEAHKKKMKLIWSVAGGILGAVFLVLAFLCIYRCIRKPSDDETKLLTS